MSNPGAAIVSGGGIAGVAADAEPLSVADAKRPLGLSIFAADHTPVFGRDRRQPHVAWCASQNGCGIQVAAAMVRLAADQNGGRTADLASIPVTSLAPERLP